jgi:hypothetical protein
MSLVQNSMKRAAFMLPSNTESGISGEATLPREHLHATQRQITARMTMPHHGFIGH